MMTPDQLRANIDTIVVVIMENRSFDNVLGYLRHPDFGNRLEIDGVEDLTNPSYINLNSAGQGIRPFWRADAPSPSDFPHARALVHDQLAWAALAQRYLMTGFVKSYEASSQIFTSEPPVMGLLQAADLPTTSVLAEQYMVCDRWFACVPASTAPNRLMSMCGVTSVDDTHQLLPDLPTVYQWLVDHHVSWRVYAAGLPFFTLMPSIFPMVLGTQFRALDRLEADWAAGDRPSVIFVEPDYYDSPIHFQEPCDNHPPLAMAPGETFLAKVYGWISSDPARWARTLLIVSYDEHGGCWDHVPPLPVTYTNAAANITFDTTGPRIPAMLAGPFAPRHAVARKPDGTKPSFDNTSILQLLAERFGSPATSYSPDVLARRQQGIDSLSVALDASGANTDRCTFAPARAVAPAVTSTALCRQGFDLALRQMFGAHGEALLAKYPALRGYFD